MAHIALLNGTNYQVGGGKVMIDTTSGGGYELRTFKITENATVNGKLTINAKFSMGSSYIGWPMSDTSKIVCTVILKRKG